MKKLMLGPPSPLLGYGGHSIFSNSRGALPTQQNRRLCRGPGACAR